MKAYNELHVLQLPVEFTSSESRLKHCLEFLGLAADTSPTNVIDALQASSVLDVEVSEEGMQAKHCTTKSELMEHAAVHRVFS
jgi:hypothetical protein